MGIEDIDSWDLDNSTWGGWGEVIGTVPVDVGAQKSSLGEMGKLTGQPNGLTQLQRIGFGLSISTLSMVPQYAFVGCADAFAYIRQLEFFYDQAPDSMRSLSATLQLLVEVESKAVKIEILLWIVLVFARSDS
uniref:Protein NRT1/ PTR FAMILY 8.1-like n=1 Tax=Tanacetum cinerariifolium TaxID=118510 RepID=A0A6L2MUH8_TANCI|nr:protein NRT1/ PTR FAMILY 8.1-like [Tanacetum cinerariifolium]